MKFDCICYFWWDRYTPSSIELFGLQMSLLLLDRASSRFRPKHEQSSFEGPEIRFDHLRLELDLSDLLVCLLEESIVAGSESDCFWEKIHTFDNASSENELPLR